MYKVVCNIVHMEKKRLSTTKFIWKRKNILVLHKSLREHNTYMHQSRVYTITTCDPKSITTYPPRTAFTTINRVRMENNEHRSIIWVPQRGQHIHASYPSNLGMWWLPDYPRCPWSMVNPWITNCPRSMVNPWWIPESLTVSKVHGESIS